MGKTLHDLKNSPVEQITLGFVEDAIKLTHSTYIREKIAYSFIKKGWIDIETNALAKALNSFSRALKIFTDRENLNGYLLSKHGIASIYSKVKQYSSALTIYFDILNRLETAKTELRFITLKDIAMTYYEWGAYKESIHYLKIAMDIIKKEKSVFQKIYIHYNMGMVFIKQGKYKKAQEALFMTLTLCDANSVNYKISEALSLLGNIFRKQQNYVRSESFHIRALQYAKSSRDYKAHVMVLTNMGTLCYYSGSYKKALQYFFTALEEINHVEDRYKNLIKIYNYIYLTYKELGDLKESLTFLEKSVATKENLLSQQAEIQNRLLAVKQKFLVRTEAFTVQPLKSTEVMSKDDGLELANLIYENAQNILNFNYLSIYTRIDSSQELQQITIDPQRRSQIKVIDGKFTPAMHVINTGEELVIYNKENHDHTPHYNLNRLTKDMESFIFLPVKRGESIVGAVSVEDRESSKYTQFDINTLKTISAYISLSIENMRIKSEVDALNTLMDSDTIIIESTELDKNTPQKDRESGLPQKSLFLELMNQSIKNTKRNKGKLAVFTIIVDLDFEKRDSFLSEDLIIGEHTISKRIKKTLRSEDILGKTADDTYILTFKMDSIRGCRSVAQKLVAQLKTPIYTENQKISPKIKIGITIYPDNFLDPEDLLERSKRCAEHISKENTIGYEFCDSVHNLTNID